MKVLFLDFDGVCNHERVNHSEKDGHLIMNDPYCVFLINRIIDRTGCQVVLSSSWRHDPKWRKAMRANGLVFPFLDRTDTQTKIHNGSTGRGETYERFRGNVIAAWLKLHPEVTKYAILDDGADAGYNHPPENMFLTSWETGITEEIADKVEKHLADDVEK